VIRALCAQRQFELTAPDWARPLPLREDEIVMLLKDADSRVRSVGRYGLLLRSTDWENYPSFEEFLERCAV